MTIQIKDLKAELDSGQMACISGGMWGAIINAAAQFSNTKQGAQLHRRTKKDASNSVGKNVSALSFFHAI